MMCPKDGCHGNLKQDDVDQRQEWVTESLHCPVCKEEFTLRTDYEIQSTKVKSQTMTDSEGKTYENF
jgi:cytochrome c-type biogenesis protein CcmH/NrfF